MTVTPTDVGLLPAIPAMGLVPEPGLASPALLWWLLLGVVAGAIAPVAVGLARPPAPFDETSLVGGLAGVGAGLFHNLEEARDRMVRIRDRIEPCAETRETYEAAFRKYAIVNEEMRNSPV